MGQIKTILEHLFQVQEILEKNFDASNMDVEHMSGRVRNMIEDFQEVGADDFVQEEED
jgi:hypothetical protein